MRLQGRSAIVTGAGSGIGRSTALLFAREGAAVLAVDLPGAGLDSLPAERGAGAGPIHLLAQDISAAGAAGAVVAEATGRAGGGLDILVNNAGIAIGAPVEELSDADWDSVMAVNATAHFRLARAAIAHLKRSQAGRIVNVASVMAEGTDFGLAAYCASKAAVAGLTRTLALELGKFGVTANYVLPGAIHTGMTAQSFANEDIANVWADKAALRRLGQPEDIAKAILFLASDDGGFVTGHGLNVDGGIMLRV